MAGGALDMALEDVIKSKGPKRVKPGQKNSSGGADKVRKTSTKETTGRNKAVLGRMRLGFVKSAAAALGKAAKAAAASAQGNNGRNGTAPKRAAKAGSADLTTKLSMTLDDLSKNSLKRKISKVAPRSGSKAADKTNKRGGPGGRLKVQRDLNSTKKIQTRVSAKAKAKGKAKANFKMGSFAYKQQAKTRASAEESWSDNRGSKGKGKSKTKGKGKKVNNKVNGKGYGKGTGSKGTGKGKGSSWSDWGSWDRESRGKRESWGSGGQKGGMASAGHWGATQKRARDGPRNTFGWNRGGADDRNAGARWGSTKAGSAKWGYDRDHDDRERWSGGGNSSRTAAVKTWEKNWGNESRSRAIGPLMKQARQDNQGCRIKVTNVPKDLNRRDIKEAFEDTGSVVECRLERGVAWVTFQHPIDAKKAMHTFDRGELNGQTIYVTLE